MRKKLRDVYISVNNARRVKPYLALLPRDVVMNYSVYSLSLDHTRAVGREEDALLVLTKGYSGPKQKWVKNGRRAAKLYVCGAGRRGPNPKIVCVRADAGHTYICAIRYLKRHLMI